MADGNELDDDLTPDSVEYQTMVGGLNSFTLPPVRFSTTSQRLWADKVSKMVTDLDRTTRLTKSQVLASNALANHVSKQVSSVLEPSVPDEEWAFPPETPSTPTVEARLGVIKITWDGRTAEGGEMPRGLSKIDVYAVKTSDVPAGADFDLNSTEDDGLPDDLPEPPEGEDMVGDGPVDDGDGPVESDARTVWPPRPVGSLTDKDQPLVVTNLEYNEEYTIWLIAENVLGDRSSASARALGTVVPLVDTDIIGRVLDGSKIKLDTLNEDLFEERFRGRIDDIEAATENASVLVQNYSFEQDGGWWPISSDYPFHREEVTDAPAGHWVLSTPDPPEGSTEVGVSAAQAVPVVPGNSYRMRFFCRLLGGFGDCVVTGYTYLREGDSEPPQLSALPGSLASFIFSDGDPSWKELEHNFTVPSAEDLDGKSVVISIYATSVADPSVKVHVDRVVLDNLSVPVKVGGNIYSELDASGEGEREGQTWYKRDMDGKILAMWQWDGTEWQPLEVTKEVIGELDAGMITTGYLEADRIEFNSLSGDKITAGTLNGDRIIANSLDAEAIVGQSITGDKIDALAINAGHINSNAITADKIDVGAVTAEKISSTALDGKTITGAFIRTAGSGRRWELDQNSLRGYEEGVSSPTIILRPNGQGLSVSGGEYAPNAYSYVEATPFFSGFRSSLGSSPSDLTSISLRVEAIGPGLGKPVLSTSSAVGSAATPPLTLDTPGLSFTAGSTIHSPGALTLSSTGSLTIFSSSNLNLNVLDGYRVVSNRPTSLLRSGGPQYMNGSQVWNLAQSISSQLSGIVLLWGEYLPGEGPANRQYHSVFVPKTAVTDFTSYYTFPLGASGTTKYLYLRNTTITGSDHNGTAPHNLYALYAAYGV